MKHVLFICMLIAGLALLCSVASAAPIDAPIIDLVQDKITIQGTIPAIVPYGDVTLEVLNPGKQVSDIVDFSQEEILNTFAVYKQTSANAQGEYSFVFYLKDKETGVYTVRVSAQGLDTPYEIELFYITNSELKQYIADFNSKYTHNLMKEFLDLDNEESICVRMFQQINPYIKRVNKDKLVDLILDMNKEGLLDPEDTDSFKERINLAIIITALDDGILEDIIEYNEFFNLDETYVEAYENKLTESERSEVAKGFKGKGKRTPSQIAEYFKDSVILTVLNNGGWADVEYIIETFGAELNLDLNGYNRLRDKEKLVVKLGEESFSSISEFKEMFRVELDKLLNPPTQNKSTGGGGGGGRPVVIQNNISLPVTLDEVSVKKPARFTDLEDVSWAEESIEILAEKGVISGVSETIFEPNRNITREEFIKMLVLAFDIKQEGEADFSDVDSNEWYYPYVAAAKHAGITEGLQDGSFGVGKPLTREEMSVFAYRIALKNNILAKEEAQELFSDDNTISDYAKEGVYTMKAKGIISGMGNNQFEPQGLCTRAQAAKVIYSIIKLGEENK